MERLFRRHPVGRAKQALASKLPVIVRNVLTNPETANPTIYQRLGVISFVAVPLIIKGEGLGILNFFAKEEHEFSDTLNDPGIHLSERMREYLAQSGRGSMIAVPLRASENIIGVLMLGDRTGRGYSEGEV